MLRDTQKLRIPSSPTKERKVIIIRIKNFIADSKIRAQLDLKLAKFKKSSRNINETNYIQLSLNKDSILIAFEKLSEFEKWVTVIENN